MYDAASVCIRKHRMCPCPNDIFTLGSKGEAHLEAAQAQQRARMEYLFRMLNSIVILAVILHMNSILPCACIFPVHSHTTPQRILPLPLSPNM